MVLRTDAASEKAKLSAGDERKVPLPLTRGLHAAGREAAGAAVGVSARGEGGTEGRGGEEMSGRCRYHSL